MKKKKTCLFLLCVPLLVKVEDKSQVGLKGSVCVRTALKRDRKGREKGRLIKGGKGESRKVMLADDSCSESS